MPEGELAKRKDAPGKGPARRYSWPRFEPGNEAGVRHGAYAVVKLAPRAAEIADAVRELVPIYSPADEVTVQLLGAALAQIERASAALADLDPSGKDDLPRLRDDCRKWMNTARFFLNDLGMTPTSRAKLGLDLTRAKGELARSYVSDQYGTRNGEDT